MLLRGNPLSSSISSWRIVRAARNHASEDGGTIATRASEQRLSWHVWPMPESGRRPEEQAENGAGISTPVYKYVSLSCGINEGRLSTAPYKDARSKCQNICKDVLYDHNILGLCDRQARVLNNMAMCESPLSACLLMRQRGFIHILIPRICGEDKKRNGGIFDNSYH